MKTLSLILLAIFAVFLFFHAWSSWDWESTTNSSPKLVTDGTEYGGWTYDSRNITANSVVYSVGLGEDTSWDEGIMNRFGVQVWGFDPTPKSIKYVHSNKANGNLGPNFHFTPEGLGTTKDRLSFTKPKNPNHVSMREGKHDGLGDTVEVPVNSLENWMQTFGHDHLDILKLDIEGSEYDVLEHWIQKKWFPMTQLLVEFHQRFFHSKTRHNNVLKQLKAHGFEIIHDKGGRGQEIAFQFRWNPVNKGKIIQAQHGFVNVQFLNRGYVEMTKSWICNVQSFPGVLEKTMFIATDQYSYDTLLMFDPELNVVLERYETPKDLKYGQYAYYDFMLFRTKLLLQLLKHDIVVWLTESDAVWLKDPSDVVLHTKGDMVTMSDAPPPEKLLQGGFQLLRPTKPTLSVWTKLLAMFQKKMSGTKKGTEMNDSGSEQLMLNSLIRKEPNLKMQWLDWHLFAPGLYYRNKNKFSRPMVILNNWIIGNAAKIARSKKWNHWYLDGNHKCKFPKMRGKPIQVATNEPQHLGTLEPKTMAGPPVQNKSFPTIPIILTAINYQTNQMHRLTIPFMCTNNARVIVLSNVKQNPINGANCLETVDISTEYSKTLSEMVFPAGTPEIQKVFFHRWYVLRDWMRRSGTAKVFVMDSDAFMIQNVTKLVQDHWDVFRGHELWFVYNPPRSSWPFALLSLVALEDITHFWHQALAPGIWTPEFVKGTEPNVMVLLGHYSRSAVGKPYPCWGDGPVPFDGPCDNSNANGHTKVLERLAAKNITAKYAPGTLSLNRHGNSTLDVGVVDTNYRHDPLQRYEMKNGEKQLQFLDGIPHLKLKTGKWVSLWGYVLEDELEACVNVHLKLVKAKATCVCSTFCCKKCCALHSCP